MSRQVKRGDTILEVLIALVILGSILAIAIVSVTRSVRQTRAARERIQVDLLIEEQAEYLDFLVRSLPWDTNDIPVGKTAQDYPFFIGDRVDGCGQKCYIEKSESSDALSVKSGEYTEIAPYRIYFQKKDYPSAFQTTESMLVAIQAEWIDPNNETQYTVITKEYSKR
ncbi:prepilin-type N-terminal cleavage/methylation domain-containing protein [Candidatus Saccharibacteria bacterium]|nr:prepilin-type N-terminal cleavage/methylation domain-containing protein [Candidatus Saccharibacteria bacterium]MCB9834667.1 prepilin-type N-terminal cleavage/methylation domain-containing protein [Candidatus Nomurabacteria bacterium]